jgi:hypothetical protein
LEKYLLSRYSEDTLGRIAFLLNYKKTIKEAFEIPEKEKISEILDTLLWKTFNGPDVRWEQKSFFSSLLLVDLYFFLESDTIESIVKLPLSQKNNSRSSYLFAPISSHEFLTVFSCWNEFFPSVEPAFKKYLKIFSFTRDDALNSYREKCAGLEFVGILVPLKELLQRDQFKPLIFIQTLLKSITDIPQVEVSFELLDFYRKILKLFHPPFALNFTHFELTLSKYEKSAGDLRTAILKDLLEGNRQEWADIFIALCKQYLEKENPLNQIIYTFLTSIQNEEDAVLIKQALLPPEKSDLASPPPLTEIPAASVQGTLPSETKIDDEPPQEIVEDRLETSFTLSKEKSRSDVPSISVNNAMCEFF